MIRTLSINARTGEHVVSERAPSRAELDQSAADQAAAQAARDAAAARATSRALALADGSDAVTRAEMNALKAALREGLGR